MKPEKERKMKLSRVLPLVALSAMLVLIAAGACDQGGDDDDDDQYQNSQGLYRCQNCEEVLDWLQQNAIARMERDLDSIYGGGGYGDDDSWGDDDVPVGDDDAMGDDDDDDDDDAAGDDDTWSGDDDAADDDAAGDDESNGDADDDYTDTNTQEEGVDEADMVKTDGDYLYLVTGGYLILYDADPQESTAEVSRVDIEGYVTDMYLYGDTALVFSRLNVSDLPDGVWPAIGRADLYPAIEKLTIVDHTNKAQPVVVRELYLEGSLVDSRRVDAAARIVTQAMKPGPELDYYLDWYAYNTDEERQAALEELKAQNRAAIEATTLEDWVPRYFSIVHEGSGSETETGFISECEDTYRPQDLMGTSMLSVLTILLNAPADRQVDISVIADGYVVYGSQTNLYVSGTVDAAWTWAENEQSFEDATPIHRFDIASDPEEAVYKGSGSVPGWLASQFNMSEWEGHLRVATTYGGWRTGNSERNGVFVLRIDDEGFTQMGAVEDIGLDESIYAARMMGEKGYLVTFRQTDPLFTIDLSDPTNPQLVGQLEVPGFSTYLHKMDENHLLAIGEGGDDWGSDGTLELAMYDISDFAHPQRIHEINFGYTSSEAKYDHHAFMYDASRNLLAIPMIDYGWGDDDDTWWDDDTWNDDDTWWDDDTTSADDDDTALPGGKADDDTVNDDDVVDDDATDDDDDTPDEFAGVIALHVTVAAGFDEQARVNHAGIEPEAGSDSHYGLPNPKRSVRIGDYLYTISDFGLVVTDTSDWVNAQEISLPYEQEDYEDWYDDDVEDDGGDTW